jgi:hypothetical protein
MLRYSMVMVVGLCTAGPTLAASWADAMFESVSRDFGSVPKGPLLVHPFRLTNNTGVPVTISNVRVSCGCVTAWPLQKNLAPGQSTAIIAQMDTGRFQRDKNVTIYVQFSRPSFEEVRLWVQANSRDDVTVTPDTLAFGQIKKGLSPSARVTISFIGANLWQVRGVTSDSNYVTTSIKPIPGNTSEVNYQLTAKLRPDTPVGKWYTDVWLQTNNPATPRVRVPLTVEIQSALTLSPAAVVLGQVQAGTVTERKIILRGVKPFRIRGVRGVDAEWSVRDSTVASKSVHVLTVTLNARNAGESNKTITIVTDLTEDGTIDLKARALVMPLQPREVSPSKDKEESAAPAPGEF